MSNCRYCGKNANTVCMNTRDCEDSNNPVCRAALMVMGGGEYTTNRMQSQNLEMESKLPTPEEFIKVCNLIELVKQDMHINGRS
jgi:hypothetical protein